MKLLVYARHDLVDHTLRREDSALLLEGSWPSNASSGLHRSLDEAIDGRFDWIDRQAADWAESLAGNDPPRHEAGSPAAGISAAYLNALALRYYLVKLLRPLAYFTEVQPLRPGDHVELIAAAGRDQDYAEVLCRQCRAAEAYYRVRWIQKKQPCPGGLPSNALWRRWAARLSRYFRPSPDRRGSHRRVVLCGNPRVLDPVCRELLTRGCNLGWLYDRFAVKSWLRWQAVGIEQLVCDSSLGQDNRLSAAVPEQLAFRGVNLAGPIRRWLADRVASQGPRQTRLVEQIDAHFRRVHPDALVLDEDATPLARAAVAVARQYGVRSLVVQHGVPCCRFGFALPAADRVLVWGRPSARRLIDWGVPAGQIGITGSPACEGLRHKLSRVRRRGAPRHQGGKPPRILLLTTVPPRDDRPDAVALHLTRRTYSEMLRMAFAVVARMEGAELIVKLHPRSPDDPVARAVRADFPSLRSRVVSRGPLEKWLAGVDCVLSCGSTAGVEASLAGVPVIQLAPPGASDSLPHEQWGLSGTAYSETDLDQLLARVLGQEWRPASGPDPDVFAEFDEPAAARIAREVLAPAAEPEAVHADNRRREPLAAA